MMVGESKIRKASKEYQCSETESQPASITAEAKLWRVNSGEFEPETETWGVFWEPLDVTLGSDARPSCILGNRIAFYDFTGNRKLSDLVSHYDFTGIHPNLLCLAGKWREVISGRCEYRNGRWCMRWAVSTNTRWAKVLNGEAAS